MPLITVSGIVTRYANYRESDRIISILTAEQGRVDAKARGSQKSTSALLPATQPFTYGRFELFYSREKYTVNQCELAESFYPLREDYARFSVGSAVLQLAHDAVQENQPNPAMFSLLYHTLSFLCYGKAHTCDLLCCFMIRYLSACGYRPAITACAQCGRDMRADAVVRFSPRAGGAVCAGCGGGEDISKTALEAMRRMLLLEDRDMDRVRLGPEIRRELMRFLPSYLTCSLEYGSRALTCLDTASLMNE